MLICSLRRNYNVIQKININHNITHFLCTDDSGKNTWDSSSVQKDFIRVQRDSSKVLIEYDVVLLRNIKRKPELMVYFNELISHDEFHDFVECFQDNHDFYVVLVYRDGTTLKEQLQRESYELPERLKIGRALMEQMVIQNMPYYFLQEGLQKNHVIMADGFRIYFRYSLSDVKNHDRYMISDVCKNLCFWIMQLFHRELKKQTCPELNAFYNKLQQSEFQTYMEIYETFLDACKKLLELYESGEYFESRTWLNRFTEQIRKFYLTYHMAIGILLLILLALFTIGFILYTKHETGFIKEGIERIGTVEIRNYVGGEAEEQEGGDE